MAYISKRDRRKEKDRQIAANNRSELVAAGFRRRDLLKMGLLTSAGMLIPKKGLSAHPLTSAGMVFDDPQSPPTTPFVENMPRLPVLAPVASLTPAPTIAPNTAAGEARTVSHQAFAQFPPQRFYEMSQQQGTVSMAPVGELPPQTIWGFNGITPGPMIVERYGNLGSPQNGSILVRQRNNLPSNNGGFGLPSVTTHLHNGHTPLESDGFPCFFMGQGQVLRPPLSECLRRRKFDASRHGRYQGSDAFAVVSIAASITPRKIPIKDSQALTFSSTNSTLVTKTLVSVYRASATDKTR